MVSNPNLINGKASSDSWLAELELGFRQKSGRTVLHKRRSVGPLVIQRPFYPEDGVCHVYVLHPPGGIVGGDSLTTQLDVDEDANVLITTPGASKLYRSVSHFSNQNTVLNVRQGTMEWFPQECIAFSGAHAFNRTEVKLSTEASFIGWEILCLGRPAAGEVFEQGRVSLRFDVWRGGKPMLFDKLALQGNDPLLNATWGLQSYSCSATFIATGVEQPLLDTLRNNAVCHDADLSALTLIDDVLVCRYLGHQAEHAKSYFIQLWSFLRESVIGKPVVEPRIWKT